MHQRRARRTWSFGAGHGAAPGPGGGGGGSLPVLKTLPPGIGRTVQFTSVTGTISFGSCCPTTGGDGSATGSSLDHPLWGGLAGTSFAARGRYLVGVFLDDTEPMDPAPARLSFVDGSFTSLSPGLRQIFFVGDGLTGEGVGSVQTFHVPDTATRLYLGFQDRCPNIPDQPGWYADNTGSLSITCDIMATVPTEAATWGNIKALYE